MNIVFEKINKSHNKEITDILNYYIETTTSAYREETIDDDISLDFMEGPDILRSFVIKTDNKVIGFCTLEPHSVLHTFSEAAEVMYFIDPEYTGLGVGSLALKKLEDEASKLGIKKILADISTENNGSINFHKKNGFKEYGRILDIGKKFGRYFGIVYLEKDL